jgi:single-stranded DNA-binding protein
MKTTGKNEQYGDDENMSINNINLQGHIGSIAFNKHPDGSEAIRVSIATSRTYKTQSGEFKDVTQWHSVNINGKDANYLREQRQIKVGDRLTILNARLEYNEALKNDVKVKYANITCHFKSQVILESKRESMDDQSNSNDVGTQHFMDNENDIAMPEWS